MASERCATCGLPPHHHYTTRTGKGETTDHAFAPAPSSGAILRYCADTSKDLKVPATDPSCLMRCVVHDVEIAALRDEVERLTRERDEVQERLDAAEGEGDTLEADNVLYQKQCVAWKARADAAERANARHVAMHEKLVIERDRLAEALREIQEGKGPFDLDNHKFACNVIESMKAIAAAALKREEKP